MRVLPFYENVKAVVIKLVLQFRIQLHEIKGTIGIVCKIMQYELKWHIFHLGLFKNIILVQFFAFNFLMFLFSFEKENSLVRKFQIHSLCIILKWSKSVLVKQI